MRWPSKAARTQLLNGADAVLTAPRRGGSDERFHEGEALLWCRCTARMLMARQAPLKMELARPADEPTQPIGSTPLAY